MTIEKGFKGESNAEMHCTCKRFGNGGIDLARRVSSFCLKVRGILFLLCTAILTQFGSWAVEVTNVVAKQRYPWNGLVDITCKVSGIDGAGTRYKFVLQALHNDFYSRFGSLTKTASHFGVVRDGKSFTEMEIFTNGEYRLIWDAREDIGEVHYSNMVVSVTLSQIKVQLWADGPYWATRNIGAVDAEDFGYYFWWGGLKGYRRVNSTWVASTDASNLTYWFGKDTPTGNPRSDGWITSSDVLVPERDVAQLQWGGKWRMPTAQELSGLQYKCDWTWTTLNGVSGYRIKGYGAYASSSIFLPAAGYGVGTAILFAPNSGQAYISGSYLAADYPVQELYFTSSRHSVMRPTENYYGHTIRPVQDGD